MQKGDTYRHTIDGYILSIVRVSKNTVWCEHIAVNAVKRIPIERFTMLVSNGIFEKVNQL